MRNILSLSVVLGSLALAFTLNIGCAAEDASSSEATTENTQVDLAKLVTIERGVFGDLVTVSDIIGDTRGNHPLKNRNVQIYAGTQDVSKNRAPAPAALATATTDSEGFFQIALENGTYQLCTDVCEPGTIGDCAKVEVKDNRIGGTYELSISKGWKNVHATTK